MLWPRWAALLSLCSLTSEVWNAGLLWGQMPPLWTCLPPSPQFTVQTMQQLSKIIATHFIHVDWCFSKKLDCALMFPQQLPKAVGGAGGSPALTKVWVAESQSISSTSQGSGEHVLGSQECHSATITPTSSSSAAQAVHGAGLPTDRISAPNSLHLPARKFLWCGNVAKPSSVWVNCHPDLGLPSLLSVEVRKGRWNPSQNNCRNLPELHFSVSAEAELRSLTQIAQLKRRIILKGAAFYFLTYIYFLLLFWKREEVAVQLHVFSRLQRPLLVPPLFKRQHCCPWAERRIWGQMGKGLCRTCSGNVFLKCPFIHSNSELWTGWIRCHLCWKDWMALAKYL